VQPPTDELTFRVADEQDGNRLDRLVAQAASVSRRIARIWISSGRVLVAGRPVRILTRPIRAGAEVRVRPVAIEALDAGAPPAPAARTDSGHAPLRVLFADRYLLIIDKPAGLLSERDRFGSPAVETLAPGLLRARRERDAVWLVHRLDAGTSGVLVLARTPMAAKVLGEAFYSGAVRKEYLALCQGRFTGERVVDAPIGHAERTRHVVTPEGRSAVTKLTSLAAGEQASLVRAEPRTGRTHQIRVHLAHLGHPLLGDGLYGGPMYAPGVTAEAIGRPMLHALRLSLRHPKTGALMSFSAPVPADFSALAARLHLAARELAAGGDES
jgi:23S rRNA pseudouridine1911/1915/1917 synthase